MATGTIVVTVLLILYLLEEKQKLPVLIITLVNIPGQRAENSEEHTGIGYGGENQLDQRNGQQHGQECKTKTHTQDGHIQFICTVSTCHKLPQTHTELSKKVVWFVSKSVHILLLGANLSYIIVDDGINSTLKYYI